MYHKTHHGNAIGTIELTAIEVRTLLKLFDVIKSNPDNKFDDMHVIWNRTVWDLNANLIELQKQLIG